MNLLQDPLQPPVVAGKPWCSGLQTHHYVLCLCDVTWLSSPSGLYTIFFLSSYRMTSHIGLGPIPAQYDLKFNQIRLYSEVPAVKSSTFFRGPKSTRNGCNHSTCLGDLGAQGAQPWPSWVRGCSPHTAFSDPKISQWIISYGTPA